MTSANRWITFDFSNILFCGSAEVLGLHLDQSTFLNSLGTSDLKSLFFKLPMSVRTDTSNPPTSSSNMTLRYVEPELSFMTGVPLDLLGSIMKLVR